MIVHALEALRIHQDDKIDVGQVVFCDVPNYSDISMIDKVICGIGLQLPRKL